MVTEQYCSFETAKLLKEKGFNGYSFAYYTTDKKLNINCKALTNAAIDDGITYCEFSAPTHQMAMAWLREKEIDIIVFHEKLPMNRYWARIEKYPYTEFQQEPIYSTYEEAVDAALKYALENLI